MHSSVDDSLPPPFVIGQTYFDRNGEYTVVSIVGDDLTIERADGSRAIQSLQTKARVHRNVVADRRNVVAELDPREKRTGVTIERARMITQILRFESIGANRTGADIDQDLRRAVGELGYSAQDLAEVHSSNNRGVFANDGDWAKSEMTSAGLHEVVGDVAYADASGQRHSCRVYRITPAGLEELRTRHRAD